MLKKEEIELSSMEVTSFWWVNVIRGKIRELAICGTRDKDEIKFFEIFCGYTEFEWRNLYLELATYIIEDVNNYVSIGKVMGVDAFNQDTAKGRHDRLNVELSKITNCSIPDIRLANSYVKDSVIYTNIFGASVWYKSCGITMLPTKCDECFVLTGDEEKLNFYNLIISTIAVLETDDENFKSVSLLRERFCKEYKIVNNLDDSMESLYNKFNVCFNRACEKEIIIGRYFEKTYYSYFRDIDYVGLDKYMDMAHHYADVILQKDDSKKFTK